MVGTATAVEGLLSGWRRREGRLHVVFDECDLRRDSREIAEM